MMGATVPASAGARPLGTSLGARTDGVIAGGAPDTVGCAVTAADGALVIADEGAAGCDAAGVFAVDTGAAVDASPAAPLGTPTLMTICGGVASCVDAAGAMEDGEV